MLRRAAIKAVIATIVAAPAIPAVAPGRKGCLVWGNGDWHQVRMRTVRPGHRICVGETQESLRFGVVIGMPSKDADGRWSVNCELRTLETILA